MDVDNEQTHDTCAGIVFLGWFRNSFRMNLKNLMKIEFSLCERGCQHAYFSRHRHKPKLKHIRIWYQLRCEQIVLDNSNVQMSPKKFFEHAQVITTFLHKGGFECRWPSPYDFARGTYFTTSVFPVEKAKGHSSKIPNWLAPPPY